MSQALLGFKNLTPVRRRGRGSLCPVGKAICAGAEPRAFHSLYVQVQVQALAHSTVLTQRYIMSDQAAQTQPSADPGLQKGTSVNREKKVPEWGARDWDGGKPPKNT